MKLQKLSGVEAYGSLRHSISLETSLAIVIKQFFL